MPAGRTERMAPALDMVVGTLGANVARVASKPPPTSGESAAACLLD